MANTLEQKNASYGFRWLGGGPIPKALDLRLCGWALGYPDDMPGKSISVVQLGRPGSLEWEQVLALPEKVRRFTLVVGPATAQERIALLEAGFGEVVPDTIEPGEYEARASRLAKLTRWLPRYRRIGELELDLLARVAFGRGEALNLNPREFALIWRLSDTPGEPVSKEVLIQDVWRMGFVPETNSIAVHMSRLRRKLGFVEMSRIIATSPAGCYRLVLPGEHTGGSKPAVSPSRPASPQAVPVKPFSPA
jgi:DNA-binding winged helix-turn-helix (wHTH) protein